VYTSIQFLAGHNLTVLNFLARKFIDYRTLALYHATSGTFLYVLACFSISSGIYKLWFNENTPFYIWYLCFAITAVLGLVVTNQVTEKYVRPKVSPGDIRFQLSSPAADFKKTGKDKKLKK
jgi:hypothetical protein